MRLSLAHPTLRIRRVLHAGVLAALAVTASLVPQRGAAQRTPAADSAPPAGSAADTAALVVRNRVVMVFRARVGPVTPAERADAARRRLRAMAPEIVAGTDTVAVAATAAGPMLIVGDRPIFVVTPADVDTVAGMTLARTAEDARRALSELLSAEREARSVPALVRGVVMALLGTALLVAALVLLGRAHRASLRVLPRIARPREAGVAERGGVAGAKPVVSGFLLSGVPRVVDVLAWVLGLFGVYVWLTFVLTRFAHTRPVGERLGTFLAATLGRLGTSMLDALPDLLTIAVTVPSMSPIRTKSPHLTARA